MDEEEEWKSAEAPLLIVFPLSLQNGCLEGQKDFLSLMSRGEKSEKMGVLRENNSAMGQ